MSIQDSAANTAAIAAAVSEAQATNVTDAQPEQPEQQLTEEGAAAEIAPEDQSYQFVIDAPNGATVHIYATPQETVQDVKQVISENPDTIEYSCFHLTLDGQQLNDFAELGEIESLQKDSKLILVEAPYTEREARLHVSRLRDLLAGPVAANPPAAGLDAGLSLFSSIKYPNGIPAEPVSSQSGESESDSAKKPSGKKQGKKGKKTSDEEAEETEEDSDDHPKPKVTEHAFSGFEFGAIPQFDILSGDQAAKSLGVPQCVRQLTLSGWNPVPRHRQLQGDLLYLLVVTLESQNLHITASRDGFYVNSSSLTHFHAEPYGESHAGQQGVRDADHYKAHSLVTLLKRLSSKFSQGFDALQREMAQRDPVEVLPFVSAKQAASPWLARSANRAPQSYDLGRPQDLALRLGSQVADSLRDWNEELQSIREMPRSNLSERVLRDRQLHKWNSEFCDAAVLGAMAVVEGDMPPLNPTDTSDQHMFLRDNIFFSKGFDGRETFTDLGGDAAAHAATGKDITGVRLLNQLDVEGLNTLGSVVVDYRGVRVVAQSVVPGIFRRQETTQIVYGSVDNGVTVGSDAEFHKAMEPVAKALHFAEHAVVDKEGNESRLYTSADVKGLVGTDGRRYVLDLFRMTPVDVEFLERECQEGGELPAYPHKLVLLRPELVEVFWENSIRKAVQEYAVEKTKEIEEEKKAKGETEEPKKEGEAEEPKKEGEEQEPKKDLMEGFDFSLDFSPDAFTPISAQTAQPSDADKALSDAVRAASVFLRDVSIKALVHDLQSYNSSPLSGSTLTQTMHQRGINMRYLGMVAQQLPADVDAIQNVRRLVVREMITRAVKHIARDLFRATPTHLHSEAFALLVNTLVGARYNSEPAKELSTQAQAVPELTCLTPASLAAQIRAQVTLRFRFTLPEDFVAQYVTGYEHIVLREVCLKVGAQLGMRQFRFERPAEAELHAVAVAQLGITDKPNKQVKRRIRELIDAELARPLTVLPEDVLNFSALTKTSTHNSTFADEAFEAGRMSLEQGQKELGLELLLESLALHEQTYGFLHAESARCYAVVSLAHYDAGANDLAAEFMTRSVVISERTVGLDDPFTIHNYLNLALYEHA
ncbi:Intracellular distribution of mitochondria, partial [Linderina pennispora]